MTTLDYAQARHAAAPASQEAERRGARRLGSFPRIVPILWIAGLDFIAPVLFLLLLVVRQSKLRLGSMTPFMASGFLLCVALLFSLTLSGVSDFGRLFSSLYSIIILGSCVALYGMFYHQIATYRAYEFFFVASQSMYRLFWYCLLLIVIVVPLAVVSGSYLREVPTLLGLASPATLPGIAERSMRAVLTQPDWGIGFAMPRVFIFSPWYTAGAMTLYLTGMFAMAWCVLSGKSRNRELFIDALLFIGILFTLTRTVAAIYLIGFVLSAVLFRDSRRIILCFILFFFALFGTVAGDLLTKVTEFRGYSTQSRFEAYSLGLFETLETNPITGIGFKPMIDTLRIPVGSHSTIISLFVRGGLLGITLFTVMYYLIPMYKWLKALSRGVVRRPENRRLYAILFRLQLGAWGWVFFQEFDTAAIASTLLFTSLALCHAAVDITTRPGFKSSMCFAGPQANQ